MDEQQNNTALPQVDKETLWVLDNYILLKDYLDRTISRIAARCIRQGNIAMEEYPFYNYILDVLEEISESGDFILAHKELYPYVEKKIQGGMASFKKNLNDYKIELRNNSTPDMIKQDNAQELAQMRDALGDVDKSHDPTAGAGMSMDAVIEKLMSNQNLEAVEGSSLALTQQAQKAAAPQPLAPQQQAQAQTQAQAQAQPQTQALQPQPQVQGSQPQTAQPEIPAAPAPQANAAPQQGGIPPVPPPGTQKVIKKIVKIVRPAAPQAVPAVPNKVSEE